jgi:uncharacterized membrane protein YkvA (DUF1232 family)
MDLDKYKKAFSESSFWAKVQKYAKIAGIKVVYAALLLYYLVVSENIPLKIKAIVIGALGYFIFPIDIIPDAIPILGFTDDLAVLLYAIAESAKYVTPEVQERAKKKLTEWFGYFDETDVNDIDQKLGR